MSQTVYVHVPLRPQHTPQTTVTRVDYRRGHLTTSPGLVTSSLLPTHRLHEIGFTTAAPALANGAARQLLEDWTGDSLSLSLSSFLKTPCLAPAYPASTESWQNLNSFHPGYTSLICHKHLDTAVLLHHRTGRELMHRMQDLVAGHDGCLRAGAATKDLTGHQGPVIL